LKHKVKIKSNQTDEGVQCGSI